MVKNGPEGTRFGNDQVLPSRLDAGLLTLGVQARPLAQHAQSPRVRSNVRAGPGAAAGAARVRARAPSTRPVDARQAGRESRRQSATRGPAAESGSPPPSTPKGWNKAASRQPRALPAELSGGKGAYGICYQGLQTDFSKILLGALTASRKGKRN